MLVRTKYDREGWLEGRETPSSSEGNKEEWKAIWRTCVPSKIRVFLWRLARQLIPSGEVLHRRNMATTRACNLCGVNDSWRHALLNCPMSRSMWALSSEAILDQLSIHQHECPSSGFLQCRAHYRWMIYSRLRCHFGPFGGREERRSMKAFSRPPTQRMVSSILTCLKFKS